MLVLGSHLFDISRYFFGDPEWIFGHITTDGRKMVREDVCEPTEPVGPVAGDEIAALYGFSDGVRGYFESRRGVYDGNTVRMGISVAGSEAILSVRYDDKRQLRLRRGGYPVEEAGDFEVIDTPYLLEIPGAQPLRFPDGVSGTGHYFACCNRYAAIDLLRAAEEGRKPLSSGGDARWALEMVFGIYASHLSGRALLLPLPYRSHPLSEKKV